MALALGDAVRRGMQGRAKALIISGADAAGKERLERPLFELRRAGIQCIAAAVTKVRAFGLRWPMFDSFTLLLCVLLPAVMG